MTFNFAIYKSATGFTVIGLTAVLWYFLKFEGVPRSFIKLIFFPFAHFIQIKNIYYHPSAIVILLAYTIVLCEIIRLLFSSSPYLYLASWGMVIVVEIFCVSAYAFKLRKGKSFTFCLVFILLFVCFGVYLSIISKSYNPMNFLDFTENIYLFIGSAFILVRIAKYGRFYEELDAFFIFFGMLIYAFLHALSSSILSLNPFKYFDFAYLSTLITMLYWSAVIPWTRRVKSKLS